MWNICHKTKAERLSGFYRKDENIITYNIIISFLIIHFKGSEHFSSFQRIELLKFTHYTIYLYLWCFIFYVLYVLCYNGFCGLFRHAKAMKSKGKCLYFWKKLQIFIGQMRVCAMFDVPVWDTPIKIDFWGFVDK